MSAPRDVVEIAARLARLDRKVEVLGQLVAAMDPWELATRILVVWGDDAPSFERVRVVAAELAAGESAEAVLTAFEKESRRKR